MEEKKKINVKKKITNKTTHKRKVYKPIIFPWALEATITQQHMFWLPEEISLLSDLVQFENLPSNEKAVLMAIFRFFTQMDIEVAKIYTNYYLRVFNAPEIRMMLITFASMEAIHIMAYAFLLESLKIPDSEYESFLKFKEMNEKYEYLQKFKIKTKKDIAITIAMGSAFVEGMSLFSMFSILLYFTTSRPEGTCLHNAGQLVSLSMRDEACHCRYMIILYHEFIKENSSKLNIQELHEEITEKAKKIVEMEVEFIKLIFKEGSLTALSQEDVIKFVHYMADLRLKQLHIKPVYGVSKNPLSYMEENFFKEHANFFDTTPTNYAMSNHNFIDAFTDF